MTKKKPVGLSFIDKKVKELSKVEKYYLDVENNEFINYSPTFTEDKIDDIITELVLSIEECKQKGIDFLRNDSEILKYAHFLIIKHFTSLKNELEKKSIEVHIEALSKLYNMGWFTLFISDMFDEVEVQKVIDKIHKVDEMAKLLKSELDLKRKIVQENTTNDFMKEKILNKIN